MVVVVVNGSGISGNSIGCASTSTTGKRKRLKEEDEEEKKN